MASLTLGSKTYAVAPFKLRELRRAAPHIDRLAARGGRFETVEAVTEAAADMVGVVAVGIAEATAEGLLAEMGLGDLERLRAAFEAVLAEAGLQRPETPPGEPQAGPPPGP